MHTYSRIHIGYIGMFVLLTATALVPIELMGKLYALEIFRTGS